ncbi:hypothetical protein ACFSW8_04585 [Rubritalea tangerina]|uniref:DUF3109 family protein n=1 Tax=Rubritalea tangerina TaxID=430798 RepID=A0ABW4Z983_9BACT
MSGITHYHETAAGLKMQLMEALVDHAAFEVLLKPCSLSRCSATCCYDGVYLSEEEARGVEWLVETQAERFEGYGLRLPDEVVVSVRGGKARKTQVRPTEEGELAVDFPKHFERSRCVFLDREGRCGIQRLCMEDGLGDWFLKPLTCWIHPLVILPKSAERPRPVLTLVSIDNDPQKADDYPGFASCTHCGRAEKDGQVAWKVLEAELRALSELAGRDFYAELSAPVIEYDSLDG